MYGYTFSSNKIATSVPHAALYYFQLHLNYLLLAKWAFKWKMKREISLSRIGSYLPHYLLQEAQLSLVN